MTWSLWCVNSSIRTSHALDWIACVAGVANLRQLQAQALADAGQVEPQVKTFKDYEPGFLHMDIKYLPRMPDEKQRRYLFVAIDRATRWVFMHIYADQSEQSSVDF